MFVLWSWTWEWYEENATSFFVSEFVDYGIMANVNEVGSRKFYFMYQLNACSLYRSLCLSYRILELSDKTYICLEITIFLTTSTQHSFALISSKWGKNATFTVQHCSQTYTFFAESWRHLSHFEIYITKIQIGTPLLSFHHKL